MGKFTQDAQELLKQVGGKENIQAVSHCVTRMRFVLVDAKLANIKSIENIPSAKGTFTQSGQFQVIIGNDVQEFYNDFIAVSGIEGVSKDAAKAASKSNQTWIQRLMGNLGEIFAPLIPALICGGLILGFRNCIDSIQLFENGTKTLVQISQFWAGVDSFLWLIGEAVFHFLPVSIVWSITKKMGTSQILGIVLGITLVSPQLLNAYSVASTAAADIPTWNFGFAEVQMIGYQAQVIPAMMAGFVLVYLEKFFRKISPSSISMIIVPFFSLVPAVIVAHTIVGPIGWVIGNWISDIVWAGLTSPFKWLFAGVFGFVYAPLVITGLHHMTNAIDTQLANTFGGTLLWPMIALSNIAQGSAVLAMIYLQKNNTRAKEVSIPACISCYLGVTEPALFGVNLKYTFPFICGMTGSALAAIISVSTGTMAASIGVGGLPGILSILPKYWLTFFIAMVVAIVVPFVLTVIVGKKKLTSEDMNGETDDEEFSFISPMQGTIIPLEEVEDQVFSKGLMGEGYAVDLKNSEIIAPFDGEVVMTFPTKHAYGLKRKDGIEVLIHLGMDTVELNGEGFECLVAVGDHVKQGDIIARVDLDYVRKHGKSLVSPIIFTSGQHIQLVQDKEVQLNQDIIQIA
ncbi:PTS system trehalose-specific EIIBC component [Candidatus Stoquefichus massiliensis]|uniref:PTS system trehalose-specific EIIBC component n=1 Tax=Candidatus Stoquefichus massiliensis TaxID=1470350 RepID=UPI0004801767|nr:PTS system trehalose-specific EIIBC component [Candidatus Stoquefichus massiliensis]